MKLPTLIATSVVRGSQQGESHGGIFLVDFSAKVVRQVVDWNSGEIDFAGRGADRGLRGITFDGEDIYVAASDELFVYDTEFNIKASYRNPFLKHCHEIQRRDRKIILTSTGFDSLLIFDIDQASFIWGIQIHREDSGWTGRTFDPGTSEGPKPQNKIHINAAFINTSGIYCSGLHSSAMLHVGSDNLVKEFCSLPAGTHNAQPFRDGILFNDTAADHVRFASPDLNRAFKIKTYDPDEIRFTGIDDSRIARQGFGRGLCHVDAGLIAAGSSPSTISLYDVDQGVTVGSVNLSMDIRNAIHGLEVWPF